MSSIDERLKFINESGIKTNLTDEQKVSIIHIMEIFQEEVVMAASKLKIAMERSPKDVGLIDLVVSFTALICECVESGKLKIVEEEKTNE